MGGTWGVKGRLNSVLNKLRKGELRHREPRLRSIGRHRYAIGPQPARLPEFIHTCMGVPIRTSTQTVRKNSPLPSTNKQNLCSNLFEAGRESRV